MRSFGPDHQVVRVSIGGIEVAEVDFVGTFYEDYDTRPITVDVATAVTVTFAGLNPEGGDNTGFIDNVRLEPIAEWSASATWGGVIPGSSNPVTIPQGVEVAVRGTGNVAKTISVAGELLATNREATLRAQWVMVSGLGSRFEVGRKATPFEEDFTLTLTATPSSTPMGMAGTKFLAAMMGGTLNLHGRPKVSWTKLDMTSNPTDTFLTVKDPVNWEPGDEIVIAGSTHQRSTIPPSGLPNYVDYAEKKQILSVTPNGLGITLDTTTFGAMVHRHHGGAPQTYTSPQGATWVLDQRAEVGLLSHNVKVQGNNASETDEFGGHVMVMRPSGVSSYGKAYISNVELYRMGQKQVLGRYPMHWHMMLGVAVGQYFTDCSVHRSYNRAITIHGTDFVTVARNVVYDTVGHAVFLEDGSEQFNKINDNLVLSTVKPAPGDEMLPSDNELEQLQNRTPSSFWITNPANEITGNVAAGTEGTGFWFIFPFVPMGLSQTDPEAANYFTGRQPHLTDLGVFDGNVCHSSGSGFDVNDSIWFSIPPNPQHPNHSIRTNVAWRPTTPAVLTNFTVYGCDMGTYAGTGDGDVTSDNYVIADNNENIRLAAYHTVRNSVVIAGTGNVAFAGGGQRAYVVYDGAGRMEDDYIVDFDKPSTWAIQGAGAATLHPNHLFSGMTYRYTTGNTLPTVSFEDFASAVNPNGTPVNPDCFDSQNLADPRKWGMAVRDLDGSVWGTPGSTIIGNHPLQYIPGADITPPNAPSAFGKLSPFRFGHLRILHPGFNPLQLPTVYMKREPNGALGFPGTVAFEYCFKTDIHKQWPVIVQNDFVYTVNWNLPLPMDEIIVTLDDVEIQDTAIVILKDIGGQANLTVTGATQVTNVLALRTATVTSYLILGNDLILRYVGVDKIENVTMEW
jgi:hypothetical protein